MAQRSGQSPHNSNWDNTFLPSFFNGGTLNSPGVSALSSNNNSHGQYTSANSTLFPGQEDHNISSGSHQDHTLQAPFSINSVNGTSSKVEYQGQELLEILLQKAGPTKQKIQDNILKEVKPVVKKEIKEETLEEIRDLIAEVKRLRSVVAELEKRCSVVPEMQELWKQWLSYQ
jgi:hypothetical protein